MKKEYVKPLVLSNIDLAEGIYAASGADCYSFGRAQKENFDPGSGYQNFHLYFGHNSNGDHESNGFEATVNVSGGIIIDAVIPGGDNGARITENMGTSFKIIREGHANKDGENISFALALKSTDDETTQMLDITGASCSACF